MWYVIQVVGGREEAARRLIEQHADSSTYNEVFVPRFYSSHKEQGEWQQSLQVLTPGYIIADTRDVAALESQLRKVPAFTRLLGSEEGFQPLDREERAWLEQWTVKGERIIAGSTARIEKGRLHILSGPLVGREADIVRVDRRRRRATVRMEFMGREKEITLELEILSKTAD